MVNPTVSEIWGTTGQRYQPNQVRFEQQSHYQSYKQKEFSTGDIAEIYHENTKLNELTGRRVGEARLDLQGRIMRLFQADVLPDYSNTRSIELPLDVELHGDLSDVLRSRRTIKRFSENGLNLRQLSTMLLYACGPTFARPIVDAEFTVSQTLRAYPSAGALYPVEIYLLIVHSNDLQNGLYYYSFQTHSLRVLHIFDGSSYEELDSLFMESLAETDVSVVFVLTGSFWRSKIKYGPRGYRYTLQESGHIAQNIHLVSQAINIQSVPIGGFYDDRLNELLSIDGIDEAVIYTVAVGNMLE